MKKFLLICALAAFGGALTMQAAGFVSAGDKTNYTFAKLSQTEGSGVTFENGAYVVNEDVEIAAGDTLTLDSGCMVKIFTKKTITIKGYANFTPATPAVITKCDSLGAPRGIKVSDPGIGVFKNVIFQYAAVYNVCNNPVTVENCVFQYVTRAQNSTGAIAFAGSSKGSLIRNCTFLSNDIPAVGSGATNYCGATIENCFIYDNNIENGNHPMINMTSPSVANSPLIIRNNTVIGTGRTKTGGISVSNLMGGGTGTSEIVGNTVSNCRYGINVQGGFTVEIRDNKLYNNRFDPSPMNGGSGISCYDTTGKLSAILSGNHIEGSLWGVTIIGTVSDKYNGFKMVNLGQPANSEFNSPGNNVFLNNGNDGTNYDPTKPYDVYNNSPFTVYAQNNIWSVAEQTPEEIAKVIYDKNDNPALGEVIFQTGSSSVGTVDSEKAVVTYDANTGKIFSNEVIAAVNVYTLDGRTVFGKAGNMTSVSLQDVPEGAYIVKVTTVSGEKVLKINK